MLVSAVSMNNYNGYKMSSKVPYYSNRSGETVGDTVFNSLTPVKKIAKKEDLPQVYDSINQWKKFCHKQILGEKLNVIA